jgi:hypothetical protein
MASKDVTSAARVLVLPASLAGLLAAFVFSGQPVGPVRGVLEPLEEAEVERSPVGELLATIGGPRMATPRFWLGFAGGFLTIEIAGTVWLSRRTTDEDARLNLMVDMVKMKQAARDEAAKDEAAKDGDS